MRIRLNLKIFIFIAIFIVTRQIKIYACLMFFAILQQILSLYKEKEARERFFE